MKATLVRLMFEIQNTCSLCAQELRSDSDHDQHYSGTSGERSLMTPVTPCSGLKKHAKLEASLGIYRRLRYAEVHIWVHTLASPRFASLELTKELL